MPEHVQRLRWTDFIFLSLFCVVLFSFPLVNNRIFTTHETVHCQNVREMIQGGDWIIPHYGGRVWMERPPLPFWITAAFVHIFGDNPLAYRLAPLVMGLWCVLLVAWMASVWYGQGIGMISGMILATMQEFNHYSTGPEADIFLCAIVTTAMAFFVYLEFARPKAPYESARFLGLRPWPMLAFFMVLGLTNLAKGLFFGSLFVCLPIAVYLLWNADLAALRRYIWLPGWTAYLVVGSAWAVAAYLQYPDVIDFWKNDYGSRVNQGYMQEPWWYYFAHFFLVVLPWPLLVVIGFGETAKRAVANKFCPERFLWCWGLVPILFFSIPQGKHHHYLLQTMAPWAILAGAGAVRLWNWMQTRPAWVKSPVTAALLLGVPVSIGLFALRHRLPGPEWLAPILALIIPLCMALVWWSLTQKYYLRGVVSVAVMTIAVHWGAYGLRTAFADRYQQDTAFLAASNRLVPDGRKIMVMDDDAPLNASWLLFYLPERATLLHNITFLRSSDIADTDLYLITRKKQESHLGALGDYEVLAQSEHSRYETNPADRYALYHLRLHDGLERVSGPVAINPLQATGRQPGPYLH